MWTSEDRRLVGDYDTGQALSDDQYRLSNCSPSWRLVSSQATAKVPPTSAWIVVQADCPCRRPVPVTER